MAHSVFFKAPAVGKSAPEPFDDEITGILLAIEEESVPARLQELAVRLQKALADRRTRHERD